MGGCNREEKKNVNIRSLPGLPQGKWEEGGDEYEDRKIQQMFESDKIIDFHWAAGRVYVQQLFYLFYRMCGYNS